MVIELLADAGIRPRAHGRTDILVSATEVRAQVAAAAARGEPIHITGDVESPLGRAAIEQLTHPGVDVTIAPAAPNAWPRRWTSLQVAANEGRDDVVRDLLARGALIPTPLRPDHTPYRLAMRHGYFDVMRTLRDAGAPLPVGLQPPALLPNAVVARNYLPAFFWWLTLAVCALGIVAAIMIHPALLVVPIAVLPQPSFANAAIGRNRVAVDGPLISVSEFLGRQGLVDLRRLVALGHTENWPNPSIWTLIQRQAGASPRRFTNTGFGFELAEQLRQEQNLRKVTIQCGMGWLWPGLARHLAAYVLDSQAGISPSSRAAFVKAGVHAADGTHPALYTGEVLTGGIEKQ